MNTERLEEYALALRPQLPRRLVNTGATWLVDLSAGCALHESGLVVGFSRLPAAAAGRVAGNEMTSLDMCWAPGGYPVWGLSADSAALRDTLAAFEVADHAAAGRLVQTLAHEARDAWLLAWTRMCGARRAAPGAGSPRAAGAPAASLAAA